MFYIQDPRYPNERLLNEALLEACENALYGAGAYAFVSADGVNLLMNNPIFGNFIAKGSYSLIIGMDEITNTRTLAELNQFSSQYPNLTVRALLHNTKGSTFHPKYSWFKYQYGGMLVLGSGNLTAKGLRKNTEAFVVQPLDEGEIRAIERKWEDWVNCSEEWLKPLYDPEVIKRAEKNTRLSDKNAKLTTRDDELEAWQFDSNSDVLIAELAVEFDIKKNKYHQVDFDIQTGAIFFGADFSRNKDIVLRRVTSQGFIGGIETASINIVPGRKYRVEFIPCGHVQKWTKGFPFVVFVKLSTRTFLYTVVTSEDRGYKQLKREMDNKRSDLNSLLRYQTRGEVLQEKFNALAVLEYLCKG